MGLAAIASIASAAGGLAGALGKGKGSGATSASGFTTLGANQKSFAENEIFDLIKKYFSKSYEGIPRRRLNAEDLDPVFGSRARQDIQAYKDAKAMIEAQNGDGLAPTPDTGAGLSAIGRALVQQMAGPGGMYATKSNQPWQQFLNSATDSDFAELATRTKGAKQLQGGPYGGTFVKDGKTLEMADLIDKYRRG